ncbi:hypothetical protein PWR63_04765 [Paraburkholderia sp. A2WS-5]|uniref:hypothetical protein n=1 Tax=unclassified Paraburkholderia TaxID=2615204 RepID=UPI003B790C59
MIGDTHEVVPDARLVALSDQYHTFCPARFDRLAEGRRMYASAMTLPERQDGEAGASYLDLAEFISDHGARGHIDEDPRAAHAMAHAGFWRVQMEFIRESV